jgi:phosphatidate phosphatase PAH1
MIIRFAKEAELNQVNVLRKQVNDIHVEGKPEVFKAGFGAELRNFIYDIWADPEQKIVVADMDGMICGFAVLHHVAKLKMRSQFATSSVGLLVKFIFF